MRICTRYTVVVVAVIGTVGCSTAQRSNDPAPAMTTAGTAPESQTRLAVEAYEAMWRDVADASATSDWQSPRLDDHATGDALRMVTDALRRDRERGLIAKGQPVHNTHVSSQDPPADPRTIGIEDCGDGSTWLKYRADTGQLVDDVGDGRRAITAEMVRTDDGAWKVSRFTVRKVGTC